MNLFYILSKTFDVVFMPLTFAFLLLLYSVFAKNRKRAKKVGVFALVFLYLVSNQFVVNYILRRWEGDKSEIVIVPKKYKVGVLLTGGMTKFYDKESNIVKGGISLDRALVAYQLYKQNKIENILITGGTGKLRDPQKLVSEGVATKMLLQNLGVDSSHIFLEPYAVNTRENAVFSAKILKQKYEVDECVLITSAFHIPRSVLCFEKVGIKVFPYRAHFFQNEVSVWFDKLALSEESLNALYFVWHEIVGLCAYKVSGYI